MVGDIESAVLDAAMSAVNPTTRTIRTPKPIKTFSSRDSDATEKRGRNVAEDLFRPTEAKTPTRIQKIKRSKGGKIQKMGCAQKLGRCHDQDAADHASSQKGTAPTRPVQRQQSPYQPKRNPGHKNKWQHYPANRYLKMAAYIPIALGQLIFLPSLTVRAR